jgi:hypothetical protein
MSLYNTTGDYWDVKRPTFTTMDHFEDTCIQCYQTVPQLGLGYTAELCNNPRYTSTCPYIGNCQKDCYKEQINSMPYGMAYSNITDTDMKMIREKCNMACQPPTQVPPSAK